MEGSIGYALFRAAMALWFLFLSGHAFRLARLAYRRRAWGFFTTFAVLFWCNIGFCLYHTFGL